MVLRSRFANALHKDLGLSIRVPEPCFICREKSAKAETSKSDVPVLQGLWKGFGFFLVGLGVTHCVLYAFGLQGVPGCIDTSSTAKVSTG